MNFPTAAGEVETHKFQLSIVYHLLLFSVGVRRLPRSRFLASAMLSKDSTRTELGKRPIPTRRVGHNLNTITYRRSLLSRQPNSHHRGNRKDKREDNLVSHSLLLFGYSGNNQVTSSPGWDRHRTTRPGPRCVPPFFLFHYPLMAMKRDEKFTWSWTQRHSFWVPCDHLLMVPCDHLLMVPCDHLLMVPCDHLLMVPCYHLLMVPCYHLLMVPCDHLLMVPCDHLLMVPCDHLLMVPCYHLLMVPCYHLLMVPCDHLLMVPCDHLLMVPCDHLLMVPCYHLLMVPCDHLLMVPCDHLLMVPPKWQYLIASHGRAVVASFEPGPGAAFNGGRF